jgi:AcrR family transcriptional regulator
VPADALLTSVPTRKPPSATATAAVAPARGAPARRERATRDRILDEALLLFGGRGFEATSLDQLAVELGVRKQTILYYFPSKVDLLGAVIDRSAGELIEALEQAVTRAAGGFARIEAIVRSVFRLALRRPELLGLVREVARLGAPAAPRLIESMEPLVERASRFLEQEMDEGRFRQCDARLLLLSVYSTVVGVATEVEVLRAVGIEPTLRSTAARRRELLRFLRRALVADDA